MIAESGSGGGSMNTKAKKRRIGIRYAEQTFDQQQQMFREAQRKCAEISRTFQDMIASGNPITKKELRLLIEKRPEIWGRFEAYLETDVLPEE